MSKLNINGEHNEMIINEAILNSVFRNFKQSLSYLKPTSKGRVEFSYMDAEYIVAVKCDPTICMQNPIVLHDESKEEKKNTATKNDN